MNRISKKVLKTKREELCVEILTMDPVDDKAKIDKHLELIEKIDVVLNEKKEHVNREVYIKALAYLAGIGLVMAIEKVGVLNPRAASFMLKGSNIL